MLTVLFILYFFGKSFIIFYFIFNYFIALYIFLSLSKFYYPHMKYSPKEMEEWQAKNPNRDPRKRPQYFHEDYPCYSRFELSSLSFGWIYYGVLNYLWIKFVVGGGSLALLWVACALKVGHKKVDADFTKKDRRDIMLILRVGVTILYTGLGVYITEDDWERDYEKVRSVYEKYLGKDYNPKDYADKYTTHISNHISYVEILYHLSRCAPSFIAKESVKSMPFIGRIASGINTIFLDRTSIDARKDTIIKIEERQKAIVEGKSLFPLCLYPEGTATNGRAITTFKKGAFYAMTPVKPVLLKQNTALGQFPISTSAVNLLLHLLVGMTFLKMDLHAIRIPVIAPTNYMLETYSNLGKDGPSVFCEVTRKIIGELLGFPMINVTFDDKLNYISEIKRRIVKNT